MNLRPYICSLLLVLSGGFLSCQPAEVPARLQTNYAPLNEKLARMISADEHAINPQEANQLENAVFLDARETAEYNVSHLPGAAQLGFDDPDFSVLDGLDKSRPVVVYCTIGYRSEKMAKKIRKKGFKQVYNLYGSIYAWSLAGLPLENAMGRPTTMIHTYDKKWGSYFPNEEQKTY